MPPKSSTKTKKEAQVKTEFSEQKDLDKLLEQAESLDLHQLQEESDSFESANTTTIEDAEMPLDSLATALRADPTKHVDAFKGTETPLELKRFLNQLEIYFSVAKIKDDHKKIEYLVSNFLKGAALDWFTHNYSSKAEEWSEYSYNEIMENFEDRWITKKSSFNTKIKFELVKQTGSLEEYIKRFQECVALLDRKYSEDRLACRFISGLKSSIRSRMDKIGTLSEAIADAQNIDDAWKERQEERRESKKQYGEKKDKTSFRSQKKNLSSENKSKNPDILVVCVFIT